MAGWNVGSYLAPKSVSLAERFNPGKDNETTKAATQACYSYALELKPEAVRLLKGGKRVVAAACTLGVVEFEERGVSDGCHDVCNGDDDHHSDQRETSLRLLLSHGALQLAVLMVLSMPARLTKVPKYR